MFTLFELCLSAVASWVIDTHNDDIDNVNFKLKATLMKLPTLHKPKLVSAVLKKLMKSCHLRNIKNPTGHLRNRGN